jgi:hypothetical protein
MDKFDVLFQALNEFESMVTTLPIDHEDAIAKVMRIKNKSDYLTQLRFAKKYVIEKYSYLMGEVK